MPGKGATTMAKNPTGSAQARSYGQGRRCTGGTLGAAGNTGRVGTGAQCSPVLNQPDRLLGLPAAGAAGFADRFRTDRVGTSTYSPGSAKKSRSCLVDRQR